MPIPLELTVFRQDEQVAQHYFERDIVKIGRLSSAHLKLEDERVSRIHAVIEASSEGNDYAIIDMGSTEGTYVNGQRVTKHRLVNGDHIEVGDFRVKVAFGAAFAAPKTLPGPMPPHHTTDMHTGDVLESSEAPAEDAFEADEDKTKTDVVPPPDPKGVKEGEPPRVLARPQPQPVPSNLASASVPSHQRALEVKLIWGKTVLDTVTATEAQTVTLGDEHRVAGYGPLQRIVRCDLEVPSNGLPSRTHHLVQRLGSDGTTYMVNIPAGMAGRIEKADGMVLPVALLFDSQHGAVADGSGGVRYRLQPEETLFLAYRDFVLQIRYVRRTPLPPVPLLSQMNYIWANTLLLALFAHVVAIASFLATPDVALSPPDELYKNRNRFFETRLKLAKKDQTKSSGLLDEIKKGAGAKAKKPKGKSGRPNAKKKPAKMASKGRPNEKEQARRALDKLLGLGGRGRASGVLAGRGLGGALKSAMGDLRGRQVGDAQGANGLSTRGDGPGGGGLETSLVGLGVLGTAGRGGGDEGSTGYGRGESSLGGKKDRDIEIKAGRAIVRGSLSKDIIRRVVQKNQAQIRYCYVKELQRSPGLYGKVATYFVIDASGLVISAEVTQSTMKNREVERCITSKIRTWRFPKPKGGGIVEVKYPFVFNRTG